METNREAYRKKIEAQLDAWEARLDALTARADKVGAAAREEIRRQAAELRAMQEPAKELVTRFRDTSAWAWHEVRSEVEETWTRLSATIEAAWKRLSAPPSDARPG